MKPRKARIKTAIAQTKINPNYALCISAMTELRACSKDDYYLISNAFAYGYLQGVKATKAKKK